MPAPWTANPSFGAPDLAHALREASETAYKGVLRPVEGTILTVSRAVADAAELARREDDDLLFILEYIVAAAKEAVANTPNLLPVLKQAGVVDSGGQGLTVIFEGMLRYLRGESLDASRDQVVEDAIDLKEKVPPDAAIDAGDVAQGYSYDVQCIIKGHDMDVEEAQARINELGLSTLVVGDAETIKVHVHVPRPSAVLAYAETIGRLYDVVVEDMAAQYQQYLLGRSAPPIQSPAYSVEHGDIATLAVVPGEGLTRVFQSLGTTAIVPGGQTMNPSTQDFVKLLDAIPVDQRYSAAQQWQRRDGRPAGRGNLPETRGGGAVQDHSAGHCGHAGFQRSTESGSQPADDGSGHPSCADRRDYHRHARH